MGRKRFLCEKKGHSMQPSTGKPPPLLLSPRRKATQRECRRMMNSNPLPRIIIEMKTRRIILPPPGITRRRGEGRSREREREKGERQGWNHVFVVPFFLPTILLVLEESKAGVQMERIAHVARGIGRLLILSVLLAAVACAPSSPGLVPNCSLPRSLSPSFL